MKEWANALEQSGMGPEYVYEEILRCAQSIRDKADVVADIGINVLWHAPCGIQPFAASRKIMP